MIRTEALFKDLNELNLVGQLPLSTRKIIYYVKAIFSDLGLSVIEGPAYENDYIYWKHTGERPVAVRFRYGPGRDDWRWV